MDGQACSALISTGCLVLWLVVQRRLGVRMGDDGGTMGATWGRTLATVRVSWVDKVKRKYCAELDARDERKEEKRERATWQTMRTISSKKIGRAHV